MTLVKTQQPNRRPGLVRYGKETAPSMNLTYDEACPKCGALTMRSAVELHPSRYDVAIQNFHCASCGPVKTRTISLKPGRPSSKFAA